LGGAADIDQGHVTMNLRELQKNWDEFGRKDPLWAILTHPDKKENKWQIDDFFQTGVDDIDKAMKYMESLEIDVQRRRALDFGCGVGRISQALSHHFEEVIGVDIAPSMIELAEKYNRYNDKCKYLLNSRGDLRLFSDNSFDFIISLFTLQHIEPRYSKIYIKEFLRVLSPEGLLMFQLQSSAISEQDNNLHTHKLVYFKKYISQKILLKLYQSIKNRIHMKPAMEMHSINREEVIRILEENGGKIVDILDVSKLRRMPIQENVTPRWINFVYCIAKE